MGNGMGLATGQLAESRELLFPRRVAARSVGGLLLGTEVGTEDVLGTRTTALVSARREDRGPAAAYGGWGEARVGVLPGHHDNV
jgi:hypothetical protein